MQTRGHLYQLMIVVLVLAAGQDAVAGDGKSSPETDLAAPGAPLYEYAVAESVKGMLSKQEQAELGAASRPPSPGPDYFWCENCKTYHKRQAPASAQQPVAAHSPVAVPAASPQPGAAAATRPPSPEADYYWCEHCKTYHKKKTAASAAAPQPGDNPATRPPSPGADYYWCQHCKTYHKRKSSASVQQPGTSAAAPQAHAVSPAAGGAAQSPGADYYYCENCKTYHRRQPVAQQSVEDLILGGVSNSPNRNPLTAP